MQGTVRYSEEFMKPDGLKCWLSHEKAYDQDTQDPPFDEVVKTVKNAANKLPAHQEQDYGFDKIQFPMGMPNDLTVDGRVNKLIEDLNKSTSIKELNEWLFIANSMEKKGDKRLREAYDIKHTELTQNQ